MNQQSILKRRQLFKDYSTQRQPALLARLLMTRIPSQQRILGARQRAQDMRKKKGIGWQRIDCNYILQRNSVEKEWNRTPRVEKEARESWRQLLMLLAYINWSWPRLECRGSKVAFGSALETKERVTWLGNESVPSGYCWNWVQWSR